MMCSVVLPRFNFEEVKIKKEEVKRRMEKSKNEKLQKTKNEMDTNRIIRENLLILKDKIIEENRQKRILVERKKEIMKASILSYKNNKKNLINELIVEEIGKEKKDVEVKENELMFWKHQYERKIMANDK